MYRYEVLPDFARYILENHLDEFGQAQYDLAVAMNLPLLKYIGNLNREELKTITEASLTELFEHLMNNRAEEFIQLSLQRWLANDLKVVQNLDIIVEDITVLNY